VHALAELHTILHYVSYSCKHELVSLFPDLCYTMTKGWGAS